MKTIVLLFGLIILASAVVFIFPKSPSSNTSNTSSGNNLDEIALITSDIINTSSNCGPEKDKCTIDKVIGNYAKGTMPLGYWFAVKKDGHWQVVLTGNGIPSCAKVDELSLPKELYTNCLETSGKPRY